MDLHRREFETPFNKAPLVRAIAALMMVMAILSALTRIVTRVITMRKLKMDDILVIAATVTAIAQSGTVISQGSFGLGKIDGLEQGQVSAILKRQYASDVLLITTLLLAKLSATRTIWGMAPRERRQYIIATEVVISLWGVSSILTSFFECSFPESWDYIDGKCFNRFAFWAYIDGLNILTDLAITAILFEMFISLKTSVAKKIMVIGVFGCRVFIIPAIICHMIYFKRAIESSNPMFDMWPPTVINQVILCMSIMATCIPYLKPFLDSLESGQMAAGDLRGTKSRSSGNKSGGYYGSGNASHSRPNNTARGLTSVTTIASNASNRRQKYEKMGSLKSQPKGTTSVVTTEPTKEGSWDGQSHTSQTVLVHQTWQVNVEREGTSPAGEM